MEHPVVHFEILGTDGGRLADFYRRLFGWELREVPMTGYAQYAYLPAPDEGIGGGVGQLADGGASILTIYVEVADPQAMLDRALEAGAEPLLPVTAIPGVGAIARFRDPQGNVVGLVRSEPT